MQWTYRSILTVVVLLGAVPQTAKAQFDRLTKLVHELETAEPGARMSPALVAQGAYRPDKIRYSILEPLRWEIEKLTIQESLLKSMIAETQKRWSESQERLAVTEGTLSDYHISSPDDLAKRNAQSEELKAMLGQIDAEMAWLKQRQQEEKSNPDATVEKSRQAEILEYQSKIVDSLSAQQEEAMVAARKGLRSQKDLRETELQLWEAKKLLANSKAVAELAENGVPEEIVVGLKELMQKRSATIAKLDSLSDTPPAIQVRQILRSKQRLEREDEIQLEKMGQLEQQLQSASMERRFLEAIVGAYEKAQQEADQPSAG